MALTEVQKVRLRIGDMDSSVFTSDDYISEFLAANGDDVVMAASAALRAMAADSALIDKAEKLGTYGLDRKGIVKNLLEVAKSLEAAAAEGVPAYGFFEQAHTDMSAIDILDRGSMRDTG